MKPDDRWAGEHGHLYDGFAKCSRCRFYAKDPAVVAKHELGCTGRKKKIYYDVLDRKKDDDVEPEG